MGLWDAAAWGGLGAAGGPAFGRRRRPRREEPIHPTGWLVVGVVAVALQIAVLVAGLGLVARLAWVLSTDDLLFVLGIVAAPVAVTGLCMGLSVAWWMASVARRLLAWDGSARLDLSVLAMAGAFVGIWIVLFGFPLAGLAALAPSVTAGVVAAAPAAWRSSSSFA